MTERTDIDDLFARFCRTGSPDALAAVFDLGAPELHRVARYLVGRADAADDLVQETFLVAIEQRGRFEPGRRVLPWLLGVLANLARRRRRGESAGGVERAMPGVEDPVAVASAREVQETLRSSVRALPEPYRGVLRRHIEDGVAAHAIAAERDVPPATVRSQLMRGLELLRRALPAGMAGAAVAVLPGRGLAAVRVVVMERAGCEAGGVGVGVVGVGVFAMKKGVLVIAAVMLAALVVWMGSLAWVRTGSGADPAVIAGGMESGVASEGVAPTGSAGAAVAPERAAVPESVATVRTEGDLVVRVRFASDAAPAVDVGVYVRAPGGGALGVDLRTDASGVARLSGLPAGEVLVQPDRCAGVHAVIAAGEEREVEVRVPRGLAVRGWVVDVARAPVGGARVYAKRVQHHAFFQLVATADADGVFELRDVEPGTGLLARAEGYQPSHHGRGAEVSGVPGETQDVTLRLGARAHRLQGEVVGEDGELVPHALVAIAVDEDARKQIDGVLPQKQPSEFQRPIDLEEFVLRCDAAGRFDSREVPMGETLVLARAMDGRAASLGAAKVLVRAGADNRVLVRLSRGAVIEGQVRDEGGAPVVGLSVLSEWKGTLALGNLEHDLGHLVAAGRAVTDADGRFRLSGLLTGEHQLVLGGTFDEWLRLDNKGAVGSQEKVLVGEGQVLQWRGVLPRAVPLRLRVLGPAGEGLAGWGVHVEEREGRGPGSGDLRRRRTDGEGRIVLPRVPDRPLVVTLHAPRPDTFPEELPAHVVRDVHGGADEVEVKIPSLPTAGVRGRVIGPYVGLELEHVVLRLKRRARSDAATGEFGFGGLPAGRYRLWVSTQTLRGLHATVDVAAGEQIDLGDVRVLEPRYAWLRAEGVAATRASSGEVFVAGERVGECVVVDGALRTPGLLPGGYLAFVAGVGVPVAVEFTLPADRDIDVTVPATPVLRVAFEAVAPQEFAGAEVEVDVYLRAGGVSAHVIRKRVVGAFVDGDPRRLRFEMELGAGEYRVRVAEEKLQGFAEFTLPLEGQAGAIRVEVK